MTPVVRTVALPNHVQLVYAEHGDPAGVPAIFLHGFTDSWRSFEPLFPHLPVSIRAFALTQRGHGDSERPASGYRTRDFAGDLLAFMDVVGLERAVIVGHSMGATNAQRFAIDHPARVRALVVAAAFASYRQNPVVTDFWESAVSRLTDPIDPAFAREFQESTLAQPVPPAFVEMVVGESLKVPARVWRAAFEGFLEDDCAHEIGRITSPTLIIWGALDNFCRREDEDFLLAALPNAQFIVYENAGHAVHWEEPERFANDVAAFCVK